MDDFLRMNLNGVLGFAFFLIAFIIASMFIKNKVPKQFKKVAETLFWSIIAVSFLFTIFSLLTQTSVNNIPRKEIDRSYILDAQQNAQDRANSPDSNK
jgi:ABC-type iron transport system FetAB permease component